MQRKAIGSKFPAELVKQRLVSLVDSGLPADEQLRHLSMLRSVGLPEEIDRFLIERISQLRGGLHLAQQKQAELGELIDKLTAPPYFPAIFFNTIETENGPCAIVRHGTELRAVSIGDLPVEADTLTPGDEVLLSSDRNIIVRRSLTSCFGCGEIATLSRLLEGARCVVKSREEEVVLLAGAALEDGRIRALATRFGLRGALGIAFEKVDHSRGEEFFRQETPSESFASIGGLERQIEEIKQMFALHRFNGDVVRKYQLKQKRSLLGGSMGRAGRVRRWVASPRSPTGWRGCRSTNGAASDARSRGLSSPCGMA